MIVKIAKFKITILFILLISPLIIFAQETKTDSSGIILTPLHYKIKYEVGRKLEKAPFKIENNTQKRITVKLVGVWSVRGNTFDPLKDAKMKLYYRNRYREIKELELAPGMAKEFDVVFEPFEIYYGSQYKIKILMMVGKEKYEAVCNVEMYKQHRNDPNKHKK
jgi:hypothetical protein